MSPNRTAPLTCEWRRDDYLLTTDRTRLDVDAALRLLDVSYWAADRPHDRTQAGIDGSLCFTLLHTGELAGLARVVTDFGTIAYFCDFVLAEAHRGQGLGSWMLERVLDCPELERLPFLLVTRDAQALYRRFGFSAHRYEVMFRGAPAGR